MPPASAPRGSPLEVAKFKRNRPASAGAPRRAPSDTRLLRQRPAFGDSQGRATPAPTMGLNMDLTGKVAFVAGVGDSSGYGWAICKALANAGATVTVTASALTEAV